MTAPSGLKVLAAMSGGVDSAVAAAHAVDAGHEVTGVHLALSRSPQSDRTGARGCCTLEDARDARRAADAIGIPFYVWDLAERFAEDVMADFVAEYAAGRTPNPCVRCNERIKFTAVLDRALALGFDAVVTGHHAQLAIEAGRPVLRRSVDVAKDQSYVLGTLRPDQLERAIFPLGTLTKAEVRQEARERGLLVADKPDSHDVCFIPTATPPGGCATGSAPSPARSSTAPAATCSASTRVRTRSPSASGAASSWAAPHRTPARGTSSASSPSPAPSRSAVPKGST